MKTSEIRQQFLDYFESHQHKVVASSPLIPSNDPTLLFTNAGMVQFKEQFLGKATIKQRRVTSAQCCLRAGGKHNDLDNVGYTARHHTFFEMLGNFSFGDYFKREAIHYSWDFLTKVLKLPPEKLWVTVYTDDDETAAIWLNELQVPAERFARCGEADNFWSMGETGPCGPCTEIFYDHGEAIAGGPPGSETADGDRFVEIWNLVFMQYDRDASGALHPLPSPSVDTGMGLERIAAVMQGVHSNYDIDLFQSLKQAAAQLTGTKNLKQQSLNVLADHIRAVCFLMLEGVVPANEGRGYVLRRILRRAIRHGHQLGVTEPFFHKLVAALCDVMGTAYPALVSGQARLAALILKEEQQFAKTLDHGLRILAECLTKLTSKQIPGETVFKLYDTYGFPTDLTADIAREKGLRLDMAGFQRCMDAQRAKSQAVNHFKVDTTQAMALDYDTLFTGYEAAEMTTTVMQIRTDVDVVPVLKAGQRGMIILAQTPFYPEGGGQVGDTGELIQGEAVFIVSDTQKRGKTILHFGQVKTGEFCLDKAVTARVAMAHRVSVKSNHTATHLLHAALRQVLGEHVQQKGSLVEPKRLRFDFTHFESVASAQLQSIEMLVNQHILCNHEVLTTLQTPEAAKADGAIALFGEKYDDQVRVLSIDRFSKELCGGTHVRRTGDIGLFKILSETGIAAGVRRIEAVTGRGAIDWVNQLQAQQQRLSTLLKGDASQLVPKVEQLLEDARLRDKTIETLQAKVAASSSRDLTDQVEDVHGINVLAAQLTDVSPAHLRQTLDQLKQQFAPAVIVLASVEAQRVRVIAGISKAIIGRVPTPRELVVAICGQGGGRDDLAQGGSELPVDLADRLRTIKTLVQQRVSA